jgi:nicotinamide mononucleotide transporter PnuC
MLHNPFRGLKKREWAIWLLSLATVIASNLLAGTVVPVTLFATLIGVTALIFLAKGMAVGQVLVIIFAVFYGIVSFFFGYYGEMITYLCMTAPIALASIISWLRHPFKDTDEVTVAVLSRRNTFIMWILTLAVTVAFYFILGAFGNANLLVSTFSVTTSFLASYLTLFRSPYYAVAYAANDVVLIILWIMASLDDIKYLSMVVCFVAFFANDMYGFFNWKRMQRQQKDN